MRKKITKCASLGSVSSSAISSRKVRTISETQLLCYFLGIFLLYTFCTNLALMSMLSSSELKDETIRQLEKIIEEKSKNIEKLQSEKEAIQEMLDLTLATHSTSKQLNVNDPVTLGTHSTSKELNVNDQVHGEWFPYFKKWNISNLAMPKEMLNLTFATHSILKKLNVTNQTWNISNLAMPKEMLNLTSATHSILKKLNVKDQVRGEWFPYFKTWNISNLAMPKEMSDLTWATHSILKKLNVNDQVRGEWFPYVKKWNNSHLATRKLGAINSNNGQKPVITEKSTTRQLEQTQKDATLNINSKTQKANRKRYMF